MELEKNIEIIDLEQLTEESNIIDEAVGCGTYADLIDAGYTKGMSMFKHVCRVQMDD